MASKDNVNLLDEAITLAPAARTASANGTGVDLAGYESATVVVVTGTITDGTHTIEVQDSDDDSTYTAVDDGLLIGTEPAIGVADDNKVYEIGYRGAKRYLRAATTVSGATTGGVYGATIRRGHARTLPK